MVNRQTGHSSYCGFSLENLRGETTSQGQTVDLLTLTASDNIFPEAVREAVLVPAKPFLESSYSPDGWAKLKGIMGFHLWIQGAGGGILLTFF